MILLLSLYLCCFSGVEAFSSLPSLESLPVVVRGHRGIVFGGGMSLLSTITEDESNLDLPSNFAPSAVEETMSTSPATGGANSPSMKIWWQRIAFRLNAREDRF